MKRIARAVLVSGMAMGATVLAAPAAMAGIDVFVVEKANIGHNGPVYIVEGGPGDLSYSNVTGSPKASPKVGNEAVKTGDIKTSMHGGKGNSAFNEVEGSEQDEVKQGHGKKGAAEAEESEAKGPEGKESEGKESEESEGKESEGKGSEGKEAEAQQPKAQPAEAQPAEAQQPKAEEAAGAEAGAREAKPAHKDGKSKEAFAVKHANVGNNGPTLVAEMGPGDLSYSNVAGSPKASPMVGNEAVQTGDIKTSLHGGKDNSAVTEVEGSEQDAGEQ